MSALAEQTEVSAPGSKGENAPGHKTSIWRLSFHKLLQRGASRPLFALAAGFSCGAAFAFQEPLLALMTSIFVLVGLGLVWFGSSPVGILLSLFLIGFGTGAVRTAIALSPRSDDIAQSASVPSLCTVSGVVAGDPVLRDRSVSAYVDVSTIDTESATEAASGRISVWFVGQAVNGARALEPGDKVSLDGILDSAPKQYGSAVPISRELKVQSASGLKIEDAEAGSWFERFSYRLRNRCLSILAASMAPADAATTGAILLGDKTGLQPSLKDAFVDTGTVHLLATAGLHVGIVVLILRFVLSRMTVPPKWISAISICMVWLYASMAGGRPAVTRAAFVATIYLAAVIIERIPDLLSALSLCALVLLWREPRLLLDAGFQLTFMTVLGIIGLLPGLMALFENQLKKIKRAKPRLWTKRLIELECLSVAAQASSAPMVAETFNLVTIYGLGANLLSVPVMFVFVPVTILTILAGAVSANAGSVLGHFVAAPVLHIMTFVIQGVASLPHCAVSIPSPSWLFITIYYLALFGGSFVIQTLAEYQADHYSVRSSAPAGPASVSLDDPLAAE